MYNPKTPHTLYAVNKATNAMTKLAEGRIGELRLQMNMVRHVSPKDARYAIYHGHKLISATFN